MSLLKVNEIQIFNGETVTITAPAVVTANDNTNAALRITQTGTGNALVVEDDSGNPDSTPVVVNNAGRLVVGNTANINTINLYEQHSTGSGSSYAIGHYNWNNGGGIPQLFFNKSKSGTIGTQGIVANGDNLGVIKFTGDDGTSFIEAARILAEVDGTPGTNDMPGRLVFSTTADNASSPTERMRIDSAGNVGIGTNSPAQKLDVNGNINATGALTLGTALAVAEGGTGATDAATARTNLDVDQAGTDNSTDVSLVTTSHDYLSIAGQAITLGSIDLAADVTGTLATSNGGTGVTSLGSLNAADLGSGAATDGYVLTADGAGGAAWEAASGVSLPIDLLSSGTSIRKSDGTTTVLSESGGTATLENTSLGDSVLMPDNSNNVSTAPGIRFEADTDTGIGLASAGNLAVVTGGAERMRIDSSGNVGIGTSSPSSKLHVVGNSVLISDPVQTNDSITLTPSTANNDVPSITFTNTGTQTFALEHRGASAPGDKNTTRFIGATSTDFRWLIGGSERMRIDSSGYLLIGYTSSNGSYKLQVNSQIYATSATIQTSDGRYKENVMPLDGALNLIAQLNPVQFTWKEHPVHEFDRSQPTVGFIAQEVQEVLKDTPYVNSIIKANECLVGEERDEEGNIITEGATEEFLGIAEGNLIALLTKALQEANAKIDALETRIQALEA